MSKNIDVSFPGHDKSSQIGIGDLSAKEFNSDIKHFNSFGDNLSPVVKTIDISDIDYFRFNPRKNKNEHFRDIKQSISIIGLQQYFSVVKNPKTLKYELNKGGNSRLLALKELFRETGDKKRFGQIECIRE